jgi:hypothetical protein
MRSCQRRPAREYKHADTNQITLALLGRPIIDSVRALVARPSPGPAVGMTGGDNERRERALRFFESDVALFEQHLARGFGARGEQPPDIGAEGGRPA